MSILNKEALIKAVQEFQGKKILVLGDVVLDKYVYGRVERVNPENPAAPLLKIEKKEFRLGCAANVALNLMSLGAKVSLGCVLGEDYYGKVFEKICKKSALTLVSVKQGTTIIKERTIESEFNNYLLRTDDGESRFINLREKAAEKLIKYLEKAQFDTIILSDYNKVLFRKDFATKVIALAKKRNIPVIVDPKPVNVRSFRFSTLICPNIKEAKEIVKVNHENPKFLATCLKKIVKSDYVIVTCGKRGMICYDGKTFYEIQTKVREVVDVTGAGDTACAVMALGLASKLTLPEISHLANYAAGVVVEKQGTSIVSKEELIQRINED